MLQPKRTKFRKQFKGRNRGLAQRGSSVAFGDYGLKSVDRGQLTARQIEAARRAMTRFVKRGGKIWIRVFPDKPITKKPLEVRQGKGKGNVEYWVAQIKPGKLLYEIAGVTEEVAREAFALAAAKLPLEHHVRRTAGRLMKVKEAEKSVPRQIGRRARRRAAEAAPRAIQFAHAGRNRPGREARPARQGAQVDRAPEDPAARTREELARRDMSAAETPDKVTQRPTVGRVVSNKMTEERHRVDRAPGQAPGLRQVHPPHHEGHGARRGRHVPRRRHGRDRRMPPDQQAQGLARRRDRRSARRSRPRAKGPP